MKPRVRNEQGFTLVELLIVVIILGILAAVAIPQFGDSSQQAKEESLNANLAALRGAVELYKAEHGVYPGVMDTAGTTNHITGAFSAANCATAFLEQLTQFTDGTGKTSTTKGANPYGRYLKKKTLPANPFVVFAGADPDGLTCVSTGTMNLSGDSPQDANTTGWRFDIVSGALIANDGTHDNN